MKYFVVIVIIYFASISMAQIDFVENEEGHLFKLIPLNRVRRATLCKDASKSDANCVFGNIQLTDPGRFTFGYKNTLIDNNNHQFKTQVYATDNILHHTPLTLGTDAFYVHKPTQSKFEASIVRTEKLGTDLSTSGKYNFFQDKTTNANVEGYASQHFGGKQGNQAIDYGIKVNFEKKI